MELAYKGRGDALRGNWVVWMDGWMDGGVKGKSFVGCRPATFHLRREDGCFIFLERLYT